MASAARIRQLLYTFGLQFMGFYGEGGRLVWGISAPKCVAGEEVTAGAELG